MKVVTLIITLIHQVVFHNVNATRLDACASAIHPENGYIKPDLRSQKVVIPRGLRPQNNSLHSTLQIFIRHFTSFGTPASAETLLDNSRKTGTPRKPCPNLQRNYILLQNLCPNFHRKRPLLQNCCSTNGRERSSSAETLLVDGFKFSHPIPTYCVITHI